MDKINRFTGKHMSDFNTEESKRDRYIVEIDLFKRIDNHLEDVKIGLQEVREKLIVIEAQDWKEKIRDLNKDVEDIRHDIHLLKIDQVEVKTKLIPLTGFATVIITALIAAWLAGAFG
jgi:hypothetical protein